MRFLNILTKVVRVLAICLQVLQSIKEVLVNQNERHAAA